jgi:hypothetical protein
MSKQSQTPFTDQFFQVGRRITSCVLGNDQKGIFKLLRNLDLDGGDSYSLFNATGIATSRNWCIGIFDEPVVVCGQLYPKRTVAVFQDKTPGSRFALFSVDEIDAQQ